jgi:hypothetical protein
MRDDIEPAVRVRSIGIERAGGSCALVGKGATEIIGIRLDGHIERSDGDKVVQRISVSEEAPLLGQSFLGKRLLCWHGRAEQRNDPEIRGDISITIINQTAKASRNQINRFRNSQNAVKGKDLISLQNFHTSIHGQLNNLGYFYEQQAGSWLNMTDYEKAKYGGNPIFNEYLDKEPGMKIGAKDAIQAMVAGITQDPTTPYGSISKFMPEGKHYADVFTDKLSDDYRLLFYPYLVKAYAEKEFNYGSRNSEIQEKKYARLLFITAYFRIMQDFLLDDVTDWKMQPQVLDPYFKDFETNKKLLEFTNKMLDHYFVQAESIHKGKMTLHTFFAKYAWIEELQDKFISYVRRNERELKEIKKQFKIT